MHSISTSKHNINSTWKCILAYLMKVKSNFQTLGKLHWNSAVTVLTCPPPTLLSPCWWNAILRYSVEDGPFSIREAAALSPKERCKSYEKCNISETAGRKRQTERHKKVCQRNEYFRRTVHFCTSTDVSRTKYSIVPHQVLYHSVLNMLLSYLC